MTLTLGFLAETEADARAQTAVWIAAEPNVESGEVVEVESSRNGEVWRIVVALVLRSDSIQEELGLAQ